MLVNAGFERGSRQGWDFVENPVSFAVRQDAGAAKEGQWEARVRTDEAWRSIAQDVSLRPVAGTGYRFSVWVRSASDTPVSGKLALWALGNGTESGGTDFTVGREWTLVSAPVEVTATGHSFLRAQLYLGTPDATLELDGAQLSH